MQNTIRNLSILYLKSKPDTYKSAGSKGYSEDPRGRAAGNLRLFSKLETIFCVFQQKVVSLTH